MAACANDEDTYWKHLVETLWKESSLPALDGIRAISCIWVSFSHALFLWQVYAPDLFEHVYHKWWPISVPFNGDMGVDFFLLLSGYLIGSAVLKEVVHSETFGMVRFLVRRVFRIAPIFYLAVFLAAATNGLAACRFALWRKLLFIENETVNLQDYTHGYCAPQSWSVGLEMQLYLMTPPLIMLSFYFGKACKVSPSWVVMLICACLWATCCWARLAALPEVIAMKGSVWYTGTVYRCAPYFTGVATSVLLSGQSPSIGRSDVSGVDAAASALHNVLPLLAWAVLAFCMYFGGGGPILGFESPMSQWPFSYEMAKLHFVMGRPLVAAASGYLLWKLLSGLAPRLHAILAAPVWRPFARLSYSAYMMQVVNFALASLLLSPFDLPDSHATKVISALSMAPMVMLLYAWAVLYTLFAFALALLSYIVVEYNGMCLGHRLALALTRDGASRHRELVKPLV
eukprot:gnl/TRDRNA2_/TRDRNA2_173119_c4_seq1.p1 gnl/TRDRNA2_/TRDRNA2_173119_c4~~gnl/TRDRNA2_/TRDRNA2_173119_c4_seq1.p1  ORF type:complete len:457 (+),score=37.41 gnl/TRDRNA2_/TRDRNA2_173119_c4_seq1:57-1427(+)